MKTFFSFFLLSFPFFLVGCSEAPMTESEMAEQYGLSLEEFQEQKEAAARMNMSIEDHLNMGHGNSDSDHMNHNH